MTRSALSIGRTGELIAAAALEIIGYHAIPVTGKKYDLLVDCGDRFLRVQVKACASPRERGQYAFKSAHGSSAKKKYTEDDVDIFAFVALDVRRCMFLAASQVTSVTVRYYQSEYQIPQNESSSWFAALEALNDVS